MSALDLGAVLRQSSHPQRRSGDEPHDTEGPDRSSVFGHQMIRTTPRAAIGWSLVMRGRLRTAAVATMKRSQGSASESIGADVDRSAIRAVIAAAVTLMPGYCVRYQTWLRATLGRLP